MYTHPLLICKIYTIRRQQLQAALAGSVSIQQNETFLHILHIGAYNFAYWCILFCIFCILFCIFCMFCIFQYAKCDKYAPYTIILHIVLHIGSYCFACFAYFAYLSMQNMTNSMHLALLFSSYILCCILVT